MSTRSSRERRAKIVATVGPSSNDEFTLQGLMQAGMNVARLNFSHGEHEEHARLIRTLRDISHRLGKPLCIMQDLQGPKIRTGKLKNDIELQADQSLILSTQVNGNQPQKIPVDFEDLPRFVHPGSRILLDDGNLELAVTAVADNDVETKVVLGGILKSNKGINLPDANLTIPAFTEKDEEDLIFGLKQGVDMIAMSFIQSAEDVQRVRQAINKHDHRSQAPIIAKLERPEALDNLEEIIAVADGVMVARGDLGVEMPPETVPIAQKRIIDEANRQGKLVITATQMLDSMINNPRPTRAEASDVANAIFDGTDAVMLSGETASGKYPIPSVKMMASIIEEAEQHVNQWSQRRTIEVAAKGNDALLITRAARELAHDVNVYAIGVFTQSGLTARLMSKAFPRVPIVGFTPEPKTYNRMAMYWGVVPNLVPYVDDIEAMLAQVEAAMFDSTAVQPGQQVVVISGFPVGSMQPPSFAMLHTMGQYS